MKYFNKIVASLAVYLAYISVTCQADFTDDYCWRDHDGIAPSDAFKAGMDRNGDPIYIGQTLFENKLVPGKIHEDSSEIHIEFHTVHVLNESVKILCTEYPNKFEWFKTRYDEVLNIKNKHLFEGGYEKKYITYVGRALSHGEMTVGKVVCFSDGCYKLTTIEEGRWYDHTEFEILTYNPDAPAGPATTYKPTVTYRPGVTASNKPNGDDNFVATGSTVQPPPVHYGSNYSSKPGFLSYFMLVVVIAALIVLVVVLIRRC